MVQQLGRKVFDDLVEADASSGQEAQEAEDEDSHVADEPQVHVAFVRPEDTKLNWRDWRKANKAPSATDGATYPGW